MSYWALAAAIAGYHVVCVISWRLERTELLNKLMSRDYHSYQFAKNIEKTMVDEKPMDLKQRIKDEQAQAEDLAPIMGFGMN